MLGKQYSKYRETIGIVCRSTLRAHEIYKNLFFTFKSSSGQYEITTFWSVDNQLFHRSEAIKKNALTCLLSFILETYIVKASIILIYKTELPALFFHQEFACQSQIQASVLPSFQHQLPT